MTSPVDDLRDRIAALFRCPPGQTRLGDEPPGTIADAVMAIVGPVLERQRSWHGLMAFLDEQYPAEVFDGSSGDEGPRIVALVRALHRAEASRRDWAAEAAAVTEQLARLERAALDANAIFAGILVGVGGEHDQPPSDEQNWRAVGLIQRRIRRAMGPGYVTQAEQRLLKAIQYGRVCASVTDDQVTQLGAGFTRPVCAVHPMRRVSLDDPPYGVFGEGSQMKGGTP